MENSNSHANHGDQARTPQFDPRFPNQNQTYNCFVNYVDYYRCLDLSRCNERERCEPFRKIFQSMCPNAWIEHWDEQRAAGTFPRRIIRVPQAQSDDNDIFAKCRRICP